MTITKQDLDNWIERDAYQKFPPQFASDQPGYDRAKYSREQYIEAAQLLAPLLLQAVAEGKKFRDEVIQRFCGCDYDEECDAHFYASKYDEALSQIEATINNTGKDTK